MKDTTGCLGSVVWPAAEILCDFLLKCDSEWLSKRVDRAIELGSGVGAAGGMAAAAASRLLAKAGTGRKAGRTPPTIKPIDLPRHALSNKVALHP